MLSVAREARVSVQCLFVAASLLPKHVGKGYARNGVATSYGPQRRPHDCDDVQQNEKPPCLLAAVIRQAAFSLNKKPGRLAGLFYARSLNRFSISFRRRFTVARESPSCSPISSSVQSSI